MQVDQAMSGKDFSGQTLQVVAGQVEHLGFGGDPVRDGDLALAPALDVLLACQRRIVRSIEYIEFQKLRLDLPINRPIWLRVLEQWR